MKERFYQDAADKNVAALVIYAQQSGYSYDADGEDVVAEADYLHLFANGCLIATVAGNAVSYARPTGFANGNFVVYTPSN